MPLSVGDKLGPYEILAPIGAGGMGEVYRARDPRLNRDVAIKVSAAQFSERFEREAKAIAALNHPNICQIYDVGPNYLVMEFVAGTSLKGPLPVDKVLEYAAQILDALDAAHRKAVTHRDLKPANILVTKQGIKLLDFGLAHIAPGPSDPTLTQAGTVLGTPAYMAPEQWEGKQADARSDIYAFGCVLYEMLTGKRAAQERTPVAPAPIESVLRTCLEKDPDDRWQSARDVKRALEVSAARTTPVQRPWRERAAWITVAILLGVALFFTLLKRPQPSTGDVYRVSINPPDKTLFSGVRNVTVPTPQFAVSPNGRAIVFAAAPAESRTTLWMRALDEVTARPLPGTEDAQYPFWSPDSRWVGFFASGKLKKIAASGGAVQVVADGVEDPRGGSWGSDDTILFGTGVSVIYRVSAGGGPVIAVTKLDISRQEASHRWPQLLPDGSHFLFTDRSGLAEQRGVYAGSVDGKTKKFLLPNDSNAVYAWPGYLLYLDGDTLLGREFDAGRVELTGQAFTVAAGVGRASTGNGAISASTSGTLAYSGPTLQVGQLTWFDRGGRQLDIVGPEGDYTDIRLSPDGKLLAASLLDPRMGYPDIWLTDLARGSTSRFTFGPALNAGPVWSPDGARIAFRTTRKGGSVSFYQKSSAGGGSEDPVLLEEVQRKAGGQSINLFLLDWSPDGRALLYSMTTTSGTDLWLLPLSDPKPVRFLTSSSDNVQGSFSPDGRLVVYTSNESGKFQVYVQTFPLSEKKWQVSTNGGYEPRWRADGREIYYLSEDRKLMVVTAGAGPSFEAPKVLFQARLPAGINFYRTHFVPSRDGQRFLVNTQIGDPAPNPITVVLNWTAGLKK